MKMKFSHCLVGVIAIAAGLYVVQSSKTLANQPQEAAFSCFFGAERAYGEKRSAYEIRRATLAKECLEGRLSLPKKFCSAAMTDFRSRMQMSLVGQTSYNSELIDMRLTEYISSDNIDDTGRYSGLYEGMFSFPLHKVPPDYDYYQMFLIWKKAGLDRGNLQYSNLGNKAIRLVRATQSTTGLNPPNYFNTNDNGDLRNVCADDTPEGTAFLNALAEIQASVSAKCPEVN